MAIACLQFNWKCILAFFEILFFIEPAAFKQHLQTLAKICKNLIWGYNAEAWWHEYLNVIYLNFSNFGVVKSLCHYVKYLVEFDF